MPLCYTCLGITRIQGDKIMDYNISLSYFIDQLGSHPILLVSVLLTLGVIFVNGWTDAPNAIATCVSTR